MEALTWHFLPITRASMAQEETISTAIPLPQALDLSQLYGAYARYVGAIAMRILGNVADTEEIVQDVFAEAVRAVKQIEQPAAIKGWLATVTVRLSRKKLKRQRFYATLGIGEMAAYEGQPAREASADDTILLKTLSAVLTQIPVDARIAWVLRHAENEPLDRIAEMLECSLATVKRRIAQAQTQLDDAFEDRR